MPGSRKNIRTQCEGVIAPREGENSYHSPKNTFRAVSEKGGFAGWVLVAITVTATRYQGELRLRHTCRIFDRSPKTTPIKCNSSDTRVCANASVQTLVSKPRSRRECYGRTRAHTCPRSEDENHAQGRLKKEPRFGGRPHELIRATRKRLFKLFYHKTAKL